MPKAAEKNTDGSYNELEATVSVGEYRQLLGDYESTDERILERLQYIESFCRAIIRAELQNYAKQPKY